MKKEFIVTDNKFEVIQSHDCRSWNNGKAPLEIYEDKVVCMGCDRTFEKPECFANPTPNINLVEDDGLRWLLMSGLRFSRTIIYLCDGIIIKSKDALYVIKPIHESKEELLKDLVNYETVGKYEFDNHNIVENVNGTGSGYRVIPDKSFYLGKKFIIDTSLGIQVNAETQIPFLEVEEND